MSSPAGVPIGVGEQVRGRQIALVLLFFATALSFLDRQILSILAPVITEEFGMSNTTYSRVIFAFVLSYTIMLALGGRLVNAIGTRLGLSFAIGFWSLASAAHALANGPFGLGVARFFLGLGEGPCFPASTKGAIEWSTKNRRGLAIGFANSGSAVGAIIAPPLTVWASATIGWRGTFAATAALGLVWLAAWHAWAPKRKSAEAGRPDSEPHSGFLPLLRRSEVRRLIAARFLFDPVFYFYMFWIPQYLSRERGMSLPEIGALLWIPFLALEISNVGSGFFSDALIRRGWGRRRARLGLMLAAALLTPASWLASQAHTPVLAIALMAALLFAHGVWITNFMALIGETVAPAEVATTVGLTGTCGGIAGMLSNLVIGPVVDRGSFAPVFLVTAVVYPLAWVIIRGTPARPPAPQLFERVVADSP